MRRWVSVAVAVLGLFVTGCGDGDDDAGSTPVASDTGAEAGSAQSGGDDTTAIATTEPLGATDTATADASGGASTDAGSAAPPAAAAAGGGGGGVLVLGDEEIGIDQVLCFFQEQPRAGLGGTFTHTAQARGTNAAGDEVVIDLSRARAEDGSVQDVLIVDIGDPFSDELVNLAAAGPEGLLQFAEGSVSASNVAAADFGTDPVAVSFELTCG